MKLVALLLGTLLVAAPLAAEPRGFGEHGGPAGGHGKFGEIFKELGLSPEQRSKLKDFRDKHGGPGENFQKMKDQKEELMKILRDPRSSDEDIRRQVEKMNADFVAMGKERAERTIELRRILTPEQFQTFLTKMEETKDKFRERRFGGGPERDERGPMGRER